MTMQVIVMTKVDSAPRIMHQAADWRAMEAKAPCTSMAHGVEQMARRAQAWTLADLMGTN